MDQARISALLCLFVLGLLGCATKNYVRQQVTPVINRTNNLDDMTAQNTKAIKETDQRAQAGIQQLQAMAEGSYQKADTSVNQAFKAQTQADNAVAKTDKLQRTLVNIDDYRLVKDVTVQFDTGKYDLSDLARSAINDLVAGNANLRKSIIVVEGFTDSTGDLDDNYSLSERRANAVRLYLGSRYNVPTYKIHVIGLGEDEPLASNQTPGGRAKNRRAHVQLMSNEVETTTSAAANHTR